MATAAAESKALAGQLRAGNKSRNENPLDKAGAPRSKKGGRRRDAVRPWPPAGFRVTTAQKRGARLFKARKASLTASF